MSTRSFTGKGACCVVTLMKGWAGRTRSCLHRCSVPLGSGGAGRLEARARLTSFIQAIVGDMKEETSVRNIVHDMITNCRVRSALTGCSPEGFYDPQSFGGEPSGSPSSHPRREPQHDRSEDAASPAGNDPVTKK